MQVLSIRHEVVEIVDLPIDRPHFRRMRIGLEIPHQLWIEKLFALRQIQSVRRDRAEMAVEKFRVIVSADDAKDIDHVRIVVIDIDRRRRALVLLSTDQCRS